MVSYNFKLTIIAIILGTLTLIYNVRNIKEANYIYVCTI